MLVAYLSSMAYEGSTHEASGNYPSSLHHEYSVMGAAMRRRFITQLQAELCLKGYEHITVHENPSAFADLNVWKVYGLTLSHAFLQINTISRPAYANNVIRWLA